MYHIIPSRYRFVIFHFYVDKNTARVGAKDVRGVCDVNASRNWELQADVVDFTFMLKLSCKVCNCKQLGQFRCFYL